MRSRSEKTQPGNPHQLTTRQHVFPRASINRFTEDDGHLDLADFVRNKVRRARPDDSMFCADRAWNHGAEAGYMKAIEDAFQAVATVALFNRAAVFNANQREAINEFYCLWRARAERRNLTAQTIKPEGILGVRREYSRDDLEQLEKANIMAIRPDGSFAMRDLNGAGISILIDQLREQMGDHPWAVITAPAGEFCVPDMPHAAIIPLTPSIALARGTLSGDIASKDLAQVNRLAQRHSSGYIFARSLAACPGIVPPNQV